MYKDAPFLPNISSNGIDMSEPSMAPSECALPKIRIFHENKIMF